MDPDGIVQLCLHLHLHFLPHFRALLCTSKLLLFENRISLCCPYKTLLLRPLTFYFSWVYSIVPILLQSNCPIKIQLYFNPLDIVLYFEWMWSQWRYGEKIYQLTWFLSVLLPFFCWNVIYKPKYHSEINLN